MNITMLPDQKRLHLQHGPIDLIVEAFGKQAEIDKAYQAASERFETILDELVAELPMLRTPLPSFPRRRESSAKLSNSVILALDSRLRGNDGEVDSTVAQAMLAATTPHAADFITSMAAVAGAVADEILTVLCNSTNLTKAYVNNGGDIALYLNPLKGDDFNIGIVSDPRSGELVTTATIAADTDIRGIATSGRHGRSHSLGIADSVTVFAESAAIADAAATIIANNVNLPDCPQVSRQPANQLSPDSDLGAQMVTVSVAALSPEQIANALAAGQKKAENLCAAGIIKAAFLCLQGQVRIIDWPVDAPLAITPHSCLQKTQIEVAHA